MKSMITAAGVALCMAAVQRAGAAEVRQLAYIQSTTAGGQYIDTEYTPNANTTITAEFQAWNATACYVFGVYGGGSSGRCQFQYAAKYFVGYGSTYSNTQPLTLDTNWHVIGLTNGVFYLDGAELNDQYTWAGSPPALHLFAPNRGGSHQSGDVGDMRLRSLVISEQGAVKCDFVPAKAGDNVGLFDRTRQRFFQSKSSQSFIAGEDIGPLPVGGETVLTELTEEALSAALASAPLLQTIVLPEGTLTLTKCCVIDKPVTVCGSGDRATVVQTTSRSECVFRINNSMAELKNVTIDGVRIAGNTGAWTSKAAGVQFDCGTVRNAIVRNCAPSDDGNVSAVFFSNCGDSSRPCLMEGCTITNNDCGTSQNAIGTVHCRNAGAVIRNCEIAWNQGEGAAGLYLYLGEAEDCNIHHNGARSGGGSGSGGGVRIDHSDPICMIRRCTIVDNTAAGSGGGVWLRGGKMVNCLVARNTATGNGGGISVEGTGGESYYCNIGGNAAEGSGAGVYVKLDNAQDVRKFNYNLIDQNGSVRANEVVIASGKPDFSMCAMREEVIEVCRTVKSGLQCQTLTRNPFRADGSYLTVDAADYEGIDVGASGSGVDEFVYPNVDIQGRTRPLAGSRAAVGLEVLVRDIGCCEYLYKKPGFCVIIK